MNETLIEEEIGRRVSRQANLRVLKMELQHTHKMPLFNPGTIVTLVSNGGSEYLDGLANAIEHANEGKAEIYCGAINQRALSDTLRKRKLPELGEVPVFVDVRYGAAWLAKRLMVTADAEIALSIAVWSGGKLDTARITAAQHVMQQGKRFELQLLTVLIPPRLNKIELAMVEAVPADLSDLHVKGPSVAWTSASVSVRWDNPAMKVGPQRGSGIRVVIPYYEDVIVQQEATVQQIQVQDQQADTKVQQQQEQVQGHAEQIQQQQQQQDHDKQQQQQYQNAVETVQQQDQVYQNHDKQDQHFYHNQHAAQTDFGHHSGLLYDTEVDGGITLHPVEEEKYRALLERVDFESMDATQSVKELLRLRERLITMGLG